MKELIKPDGSKTDVFAIEVPEDAYDFEVLNTYRKEIRYLHKGSENPLTGVEKHSVIPIDKFTTLEPVSILGTCSADSIDFDVSGILDVEDVQNGIKLYLIYGKVYNNPIEHARILSTSNVDQSFRSLLAHNGLYWQNPLKKPSFSAWDILSPAVDTDTPILEWQALEDKKLKGKLLFIQNKNH